MPRSRSSVCSGPGAAASCRTYRDIEAAVWGTDDYELARSLVDTTTPETDLFAGVRELVQR